MMTNKSVLAQMNEVLAPMGFSIDTYGPGDGSLNYKVFDRLNGEYHAGGEVARAKGARAAWLLIRGIQAGWDKASRKRTDLQKGTFTGVDEDGEFMGGIDCWIDVATGICYCDEGGEVRVRDLDIEVPGADKWEVRLSDGTVVEQKGK